MTYHKEWLFDIQFSPLENSHQVLMGDNTPCIIEGVGTIELKGKNPCDNLKLSNVLLVL
eukprot:c2251_g1_i1 orf=75-251(+)